jgi:hypothetical protein
MDEELLKVTPDKEKAKSILKMVETRLELLATINHDKFSSPVFADYYEVIKELITIILLLDGFKTLSHKTLIEYLQKNYKDFTGHEIAFLDDLRIIRNKISYNGFFIKPDYLERKEQDIFKIISKLRVIVKKKLG